MPFLEDPPGDNEGGVLWMWALRFCRAAGQVVASAVGVLLPADRQALMDSFFLGLTDPAVVEEQ